MSSTVETEFPITPSVPTAAEKQAALDLVLESTLFLRAPQIRNFLRYIGEMEIAGRASELNEYLIGVEALGRPPGYSTTDDSTVRRRAHALRQKLEEIYSTQLSNAPLRVDLPKGSYVPRFVRWMPEAPPETVTGPNSEAEAVPAKRHFGVSALVIAAFVGALVASIGFLWPRPSPSKADPVLAEAWGPFLRPGATVSICISSPPHFGLLPYPDGPLPPGVFNTPVFNTPEQEGMMDWYRQRYPLKPGERLRPHLTSGPLRLGEVRALLSMIRTMDRLGVNYDVLPEKDVSLPALRGRNLLLFANPEYSFAASALLEKTPLTMAYDPASRERVIRVQQPGPAQGREYVPQRDQNQQLAEVYGLITVLPSEGPPGAGSFRTVVISCTNSAGCEGAAEFFTSRQKMAALRDKLRQAGYNSFPRAYQVVIRAKVHQNQAVASDYEWHYVPSN